MMMKVKGKRETAPGLTPTAACFAGSCSSGDERQRERERERESREGLVRGAESSIHMDLRRGEDEEMGWEREVGAATPWAAGDDVGRRRKQRREERK